MQNVDIVKVVMVKDGELENERIQIRSADDAAQLIRRYVGGADREHFVCLMLDTKHFVNAIHTVSIGSLDAAIVHPREVFKPAILANSSGIIVAHNHPSGQPAPSDEDIAVTHRLLDAGRILGIQVIDHIIVGDPSFTSLMELGYFPRG
ncbi:JAB domain-containing protein [Alicyclobacillus fodiniaquatilis]|uniref:RadC family protein n=1 Tax=Alicyclobacillus fodiniaquatilis TaxID=1661150 RepID=A0ABW4JCY7_9BACL